MKTTQIMKRQLDCFEVLQRTNDSMFNATSLLKQWNNFSGQQKQMVHFFENKATKEFIDAIAKDELKTRKRNSVIGDSIKVYVKTKGGKDRGATWMHPLLFIDFAMWLNPAFKVKVLKFVYDELIQSRHEAGDNFKVMNSAICKLPKVTQEDYSYFAKAVNYITFGKHEEGLRNSANPEQLKELSKIQATIADNIELGLINNKESLILFLRKWWTRKYTPSIFLE